MNRFSTFIVIIITSCIPFSIFGNKISDSKQSMILKYRQSATELLSLNQSRALLKKAPENRNAIFDFRSKSQMNFPIHVHKTCDFACKSNGIPFDLRPIHSIWFSFIWISMGELRVENWELLKRIYRKKERISNGISLQILTLSNHRI